jgi:hypothetical protein
MFTLASTTRAGEMQIPGKRERRPDKQLANGTNMTTMPE